MLETNVVEFNDKKFREKLMAYFPFTIILVSDTTRIIKL
jgi:hypothetical protein